MFKRVHLILGFFVALYFLPYINNKIVFFPTVILASFVPDFDLIFFPKLILKPSKISELKGYKKFMHSYTFCVFLSILLVFFYPILALPFFIGYSFHLFFDSLTISGISPFWPAKTKTKGFIHPNGTIEKTIEVILLILSLVLVFRYLFKT